VYTSSVNENLKKHVVLSVFYVRVLICSLHAFSVHCVCSPASFQSNQLIIPSFKVRIQLLLAMGENSNKSWAVVYSATAVSYNHKMLIKFVPAGLMLKKLGRSCFLRVLDFLLKD
jgi:hypothetical protein